MATFSRQALGQVVRRRREAADLTQAELGAEAGYGAGAGVSISRLENGQLLPGPAKLAGIARALGLTVDELEAQAAERTAAAAAEVAAMANADPARGGGAPGSARRSPAPRPSSGGGAPPGQKELNQRSEAVTAETAERARVITELSEAYNEQYDRAREGFLLPFDELGARLEGATRLDPALVGDETSDDAAASLGGPPIADGVALARPGVLGGRVGTVGAAGVVLAGLALMPAAALLGGGLVWMVRRDRKQRQELAAQLDQAEAALAATQPGMAALASALPRAAATLDYVATHGGHALDRWIDQLGPEPPSFAALDAADQRSYQAFLEVATAQLAVATFDFAGLLTTTGTERDQLVQRCDQVLSQAQATVEAHV